MGDRGNIAVRQCDQREVFLYTHWRGSAVPAVVQRALARRERWADEAYLTRILFCTLVEGDEAGATGYGISVTRPDSEHEDVLVDCATQTVSYRHPGTGVMRLTRPFEQFVALSELQRELERIQY